MQATGYAAAAAAASRAAPTVATEIAAVTDGA